MGERSRVADFWDGVLTDWIAQPDDPTAHLVDPLPDWFASYTGTSDGSVDLTCYPDPYVGDLRGDTHSVRTAVLGLNPGTGYPSLQGHEGLWTERIRQYGYSHCFQRSPAEDPDAWAQLHGKPSLYWKNLVTFTRRWLDDQDANVHDILNLELYPWHSKAITGPMKPSAHLIHDYVWSPLMEVDTAVVFAFGAAYFEACDDLEVPVLGRWGKDGEPFPELDEDKGWRVAAHRLPSGQVVAVSAQPGYSGPPGPARLEILRQLLGSLDSRPGGAVHASAPPSHKDVVRQAGHAASPGRGSDGGAASNPHTEVDAMPLYWRQALLALQTVGVLHRRGFQHLRIHPGMADNGLYWRCTLVPAARLSGRAGFTVDDDLADAMFWEMQRDVRVGGPHPPIAPWGPSEEDRTVLGVPDADHLSPEDLADRLVERYPSLLDDSRGSDGAYAGWFLERLGDAEHGLFPLCHDNGTYHADHNDELWMCGPGADPEHLTTRPLPPPPPVRPEDHGGDLSAADRRRERLTWQPGDLVFIDPEPDGDQDGPSSAE